VCGNRRRLLAAGPTSLTVTPVEPPLSRVRLTLVCDGCEVRSWGAATGWRAYRSDDPEDDDDEPEVLFFCRQCSEREFG
jgi:hypothetical protein